LALKPGVRVIGACAAETILTGTTAPAASVVTVTSAGEAAGVSNLSIINPPQRAVHVEGDGVALALDGVVIDGSFDLGILVDDAATLQANRLVVRNTVDGPEARGTGVKIQLGARVTLAKVVLEHNLTRGIDVVLEGSFARLSDVLISDTQLTAGTESGGWGMNVLAGADVEATGLVVERSRNNGILVQGVDSTLTLTHGSIRGTIVGGPDVPGLGLTVVMGGHAEAEKLLFEDNRDGVFVGNGASSARISDVVVRDTAGEEGEYLGRGFNVLERGQLELVRARIERADNFGIFGGGSELLLEDIVVRDITLRGIVLSDGVTFEMNRVLVSDCRAAGVYVGGGGSNGTLSNVAIRDTRSYDTDGTFGHGLHVEDAARLTASRLAVMGSRGAGVAIVDAEADLSDAFVASTSARECAATTCPSDPFGYNFVSVVGGTLTVDRFESADASLCGVLVDGASLDLSNGSVHGAPIGACVQVEGYDFNRLTRGVRYVDNDANLQSTRLPVPSTAPLPAR
jgi:hypothetical protein